MNPSKFKVGDRVLVGTQASMHNGKHGTVLKSGERYTEVELDDGKRFSFYHTSLHSSLELSPQSPQPQQTQQKEDTVMYAVINYYHTNGGVNTTNYNTEAEAKTQAERLIAGYRSNIQVKQYFTVSIIELKTGKLVGSVVDAPPSVDWATS